MHYREIRDLKKFYSESFPEMTDYVPTGIEKIAMLLKAEEVSGALLEIKERLDDINDSLENHE